MTIEQALIYAKKEIHSDHAKILLGDLLNLNPLELLVHLNDEVPDILDWHYVSKMLEFLEQFYEMTL